MSIYRGDDGAVLKFTIRTRDGDVVNITGSTVDVTIIKGQMIVERSAVITDGENGLCQLTLSSTDVDTIGIFPFQAKVTFQNGKGVSCDTNKYVVSKTIKD